MDRSCSADQIVWESGCEVARDLAGQLGVLSPTAAHRRHKGKLAKLRIFCTCSVGVLWQYFVVFGVVFRFRA